jgi:hypothetical protein
MKRRRRFAPAPFCLSDQRQAVTMISTKWRGSAAARRQPGGPKLIHRAAVTDILQPNLGRQHAGLVRAIGFQRGINLRQHFRCLALDVL